MPTPTAAGFAFEDLVTPAIRAIHPYEPGKPIEEVERELGSARPPGGAIKLASNENPLGPSPRALEAVRAQLGRLHLYPDGGSFYRRQRLAEHHRADGVEEDAVAPREVVQLLDRVRTPLNVNALAQVAARAALDDHAHLEAARTVNREGLAELRPGLVRLGLRPGPTQANFLLVEVAPHGGRELFASLLRRGVIVRPLDGYGLPHHLRITVGTAGENQRLLAALGEALSAAPGGSLRRPA